MFESMTFDELTENIGSTADQIRNVFKKLRETCDDPHYIDIGEKSLDELVDLTDQLPDSKRELDLN